MIVLDIEASGLDSGKCGIWQIGALDLESKEEFLEEARIDDEDEIFEEALKVIGKREEELRDSKKQSQKELIERFLEWLKRFDERILMGQNIGWDMSFIQNKCIRYGIHDKFRKITGQRTIDLHTIANLIYKDKYGEFKTEKGKSSMSLSSILEFCGLKDERREMEGGEVVKEGKPHNALEDCKLEAECYFRLVHGKNLFEEYSKFKIPEHLLEKSKEGK